MQESSCVSIHELTLFLSFSLAFYHTVCDRTNALLVQKLQSLQQQQQQQQRSVDHRKTAVSPVSSSSSFSANSMNSHDPAHGQQQEPGMMQLPSPAMVSSSSSCYPVVGPPEAPSMGRMEIPPPAPPANLEPEHNTTHQNSEQVLYSTVFQSAPVGMALASLGGQLLEGNALFCQWAQRSTSDLRDAQMTVFHLMAPSDLPEAFAKIHAWLSAPPSRRPHEPLWVRGTAPPPLPPLQHGGGGGGPSPPAAAVASSSSVVTLQISMVLGADGTRQYLCLTLMEDAPSSSRVVVAQQDQNDPQPVVPQVPGRHCHAVAPPMWIAPDTTATDSHSNANTTHEVAPSHRREGSY